MARREEVISRCSLALVVWAGMVSCTRADDPPPYPLPEVSADGELVARIGPVSLTTKEFEKRIQQQGPLVRQQLVDPAQRRKFVDNEIRSELLAQEAWARGLYKDPKIVADLKRAMVQRIMREQIESVSSGIVVSEDEIRAEYAKRETEFNKPEKIRLSQILRTVRAPSERALARKFLESTRKGVIAEQERKNEGAFGDAARKYTQDEATRSAGGDIQFLTRSELASRYSKEVADRMFDVVQVGDLEIADAPDAVVLLKKTGLRRGVVRTLEMVKPQLNGQLLQEKRTRAFEAKTESIMKKNGVVLDLAAIDRITVTP